MKRLMLVVLLVSVFNVYAGGRRLPGGVVAEPPCAERAPGPSAW
ncbi:MAG TPA: hypothetical protein VNX25_08375 [Verrucomicrobiae bacterium]|nr:hypothetical protein [Verrucomicrobiae bacterium]